MNINENKYLLFAHVLKNCASIQRMRILPPGNAWDRLQNARAEAAAAAYETCAREFETLFKTELEAATYEKFLPALCKKIKTWAGRTFGHLPKMPGHGADSCRK